MHLGILGHEGKKYKYYDVKRSAEDLDINLWALPFSVRVLLENVIRCDRNNSALLSVFAGWSKGMKGGDELSYFPSRVLMQDFTGVPAVVDLASMRDEASRKGVDPGIINPQIPVDLIIDHSVSVDYYGTSDSFKKNVMKEFDRNEERYSFLKWAQKAFRRFRVVPPGTGICHQVNLEYLGQVVCEKDNLLYPDTLVGTDSHTTMINALGILGWGVGGIEAEAAMLKQPVSVPFPKVVGVKLKGELQKGVTATDLVLTLTELLRKKSVVGKFVEFCGDGISMLTLADRATISNMCPEYGATCSFFPVDEETVRYMKKTGRDGDLVEACCRAQGLWRSDKDPHPVFQEEVELDLSSVEPSLAGPKRPQDRHPVNEVASSFKSLIPSEPENALLKLDGESHRISSGDVTMAAITSCTNTSNPSVMVAAGLIAEKALSFGLKTKPWVKTSLAPGSKVVKSYLENSGLQKCLDKLGFYLVGYGCTTCIGNSGPMRDEIEKVIKDNDLSVASVLSGNRNFEGRINPLIKLNYLASPPLVVVYALTGTLRINLFKDPIGVSKEGNSVYLKDIWPSSEEIEKVVESRLTSNLFQDEYSAVFQGEERWNNISVPAGGIYEWDPGSTYIKRAPYFDQLTTPEPFKDASILAILGDSVTTDHISPAGVINLDTPAFKYLIEKGVEIKDMNSYGSRRGNHEVMIRGTFANIRIKNLMVDPMEGGFTKYEGIGEPISIYAAAAQYRKEKRNLVVIAGKEYGMGSSRDWAAKGTMLLGIKAIMAESFERIHRSNLVGMGVLPLRFPEGVSAKTLGLTGTELISIHYENLSPGADVRVEVKFADGKIEKVVCRCMIETPSEMDYFIHGGILPFVLETMVRTGRKG